MSKTEIKTERAPSAIGPYSQAIQFENLLFTSGQIPVDPATGEIVSGGIAEQTKQVLTNLEAVLSEAGSGLSDVIKTTVFIKNMDDFGELNQVYSSYFAQPYPARSCVEVSRLPKNVLVEIEAVAAAGRNAGVLGNE